MEKIFKSFATVVAMTLAAVMTQIPAMADEIVFTSSIPSRAVVTEIRNIGINFAGFSYVSVDPEMCEVSFGDRKLTAYLDYELMFVDGGAAFFSFAFLSPLQCETPSELTIILNQGCVGLWNNPESEERVSVDTPIRLTYTVAPKAKDDVELALASVTTPNDKGELGFVVDGVERTYNRFYLKTEAPDILTIETEVPNVTVSGPEGYHAEAKLNQAYGTAENESYFYFDVEQAPTVIGDYSIVVSANAVADALRLANPEFGRANAEAVINFKMVENTVGVEQVKVGDSETPRVAYNLNGMRVAPGDNHPGVVVFDDGTKIIR